MDCGVHEDDHACIFPEFLRRVNEFMVALDASLAAVGSAGVVDGLDVGGFVDVDVWVGPTEEDNFGHEAIVCDVEMLKPVMSWPRAALSSRTARCHVLP